MPKCPKCKQHINQLSLTSTDGGAMYLDEEGKIHTDWNSEVYGDELEDNFASCPECGKKLFTDFQKAVDFLKGN